MHKEHSLVTGGDIQIFSAIINGVIVAGGSAGPDDAARRLMVERAFRIFDEFKAQHAEREPKLKRPAGY